MSRKYTGFFIYVIVFEYYSLDGHISSSTQRNLEDSVEVLKFVRLCLDEWYLDRTVISEENTTTCSGILAATFSLLLLTCPESRFS